MLYYKSIKNLILYREEEEVAMEVMAETVVAEVNEMVPDVN